MLWDALGMKGYAIMARDGPLGTVIDLLFDDRSWKLRWLVGDTRYWIPHHEVLLTARSMKGIDPGRRRVSVALKMHEIEASPAAGLDPPVSRQADVPSRRRAALDPHLRSVEAVVGHRVHTPDGVIGHVEDLLVVDTDWSIQFLRVEPWNWHPGQYILLPPRILREIDWPSRSIHLDVDRRQIESSPPCILGPPGEDASPSSCGIRVLRR